MGEAATGLTTKERVKALALITVGTHDELIGDLIGSVTDEVEKGIGSKIIAAEYTDTLSGSSLGALLLLHGPVIEFRVLQLNGTTVDSDTYEVDSEAATVEKITSGVISSWVDGTRNYTAQYTAGYETIPAGLAGIATDIVARRLLAVTRKNIGVLSEAVPSGGSTTFESREITDAEWKKLRQWGRL